MPQRSGRSKSGKCVYAGNAASSPEPTGVETQPGSNGVKGSLMNTFGSWGSSATQNRVGHCNPQIPRPFDATCQLDLKMCLSPPSFIAIGLVHRSEHRTRLIFSTCRGVCHYMPSDSACPRPCTTLSESAHVARCIARMSFSHDLNVTSLEEKSPLRAC